MLPIRLALCFVLLSPAAAFAAPSCPAAGLEQTAREVAEAFASGSMTAIAARLPDRPMRLSIEHSLDDRTERHTVRLRTLDARIQRLDRADRRPSPRGRRALEGMACSGLVCRFGPSSILHNNLYVKEIGFARQRGCLSVSRILLLDGD